MTVPDNAPQDSSRDEEIYIGREIAYYGAVVGAWVNTRMERDKSLLTLSLGGIALLGTVTTTIGVHGQLQIVTISAGFLGFLVCAVAAVAAFHWNADYLESEIKAGAPDGAKAMTPKRLEVADITMFAGFTLGLVSTVALGILFALTPPREEAQKSGAPSASAACCCGPGSASTTTRDSTNFRERSTPVSPDSSSKVRPVSKRRRFTERARPSGIAADSALRGADPAGMAKPSRNTCPPASSLPGDGTGRPQGA